MADIVDFYVERDKRDGEAYRLLQAETLSLVFAEHHGGRAPGSADELWAWLGTAEGKVALAPHLNERGKIKVDPRLYDAKQTQ